MKKMLRLEIRKRLYHAFIIRHFNYCSEAWHFCSKNGTAKLGKAHERALRFIFNEKQTPYCELLNKIRVPSLANQRLVKIICTVFTAINNEHAPTSIKKPIEFRNTKYDLRWKDILKLPKDNMSIYSLKS